MLSTKFGHIALILLMMTGSPKALAKPGPHPPFDVTGAVVKNNNIDTIKLETTDKGLFNVRFSIADTPETGQALIEAGYACRICAEPD